MTDQLSHIKRPTLRPLPEDGLCEVCKKNELKYRKHQLYMCLHCWERDEYPQVANFTDEQLREWRAENVRKALEAPKPRGIVNAAALGFRGDNTE